MRENKRRAPTEEEKRMENIFDTLKFPNKDIVGIRTIIFRSNLEKEMLAWIEENMEHLQSLSAVDQLDAQTAIVKKIIELIKGN